MTLLEKERGVHGMEKCVSNVRSLHSDRGACSRIQKESRLSWQSFHSSGKVVTRRSVTTVSQIIRVWYVGKMVTPLRL
jgi:hypothetical protein